MGLLDGVEGIVRKSMTLFFLIDTSGSMTGVNIAAVNDAMRELLKKNSEIEEVSKKNPDAKIKFAVLSFSSGTDWITPTPIEFDGTYKWKDLQAGGVTDLGEAFLQLDSKLDRNAFLQDPAGVKAPVVILLTDGEPTDDYKKGLSKLQQNKWFNKAVKIALAVDDANMDVLKEFTGNVEAVIYLKNKALLKNLIKVVSVTSSTMASKKAGDSADDAKATQDAVIETVNNQMKELGEEDNVDEGW